MAEQFANDASTTLSAPLSSSATSLTVNSVTGFPTAGNFRIRIGDEILLVTAVSGTTWSVTRAAEPVGGVQVAGAYLAGATVTCVLTAASVQLAGGGGGGSIDVQLYGGGGTYLGAAANSDGSILFQDSSGNLAQDFPQNFFYDVTGAFVGPTTLCIGDSYNGNSPGAIGLYDVNMYTWQTFHANNGNIEFGCGIIVSGNFAIKGQTSGSGSSAGTLTNAPAVGNPTFWLPININGFTYYVPCWS